jgi:hypothetical protein
MPDLEQLARLAESEFSAIVSATVIFRNKLRVVLLDDSYIDFWWSRRFPGRFAYHWERTLIDRWNSLPARQYTPFALANSGLFPQALSRRRPADSY